MRDELAPRDGSQGRDDKEWYMAVVATGRFIAEIMSATNSLVY